MTSIAQRGLARAERAVARARHRAEALAAWRAISRRSAERLYLATSLPPSANALRQINWVRRTQSISRRYEQWLAAEEPHLEALLAGHVPDTERWWYVEIKLWTGGHQHGDTQNYDKALFDLLGTRAHPRWWDDDGRVADLRVTLIKCRCQLPRAMVIAVPAPVPPDE